MSNFFSFLATFPKNRASYVNFVPFFGVLCVHNFVVFMRKKSTKVQPPHDRLLDPPLVDMHARQQKTSLLDPILITYSAKDHI